MNNLTPDFSLEEQKIWDMLIEIQATFIKLPDLHPTAVSEMTTAIHRLQSLMEHRLLKKILPNHFS